MRMDWYEKGSMALDGAKQSELIETTIHNKIWKWFQLVGIIFNHDS